MNCGQSGQVIIRNGDCVPLASLPPSPWGEFAAAMIAEIADGARVAAYFGMPADEAGDGTRLDLFALLARDERGELRLLRTRIVDRFQSLASRCVQVQLFEREIAEQYGVVVEDHPWFKPVRNHRAWNGGTDAWGRPADTPLIPADIDYYRVEGDEVHEVAVGPVHAGIIEPGHFRFQCHGETVLHLEIALGYQHRGVEPLLQAKGTTRAQAGQVIETVAGDTTIGHATAHALVREALAGTCAPPRAAALRAIALELERLACHVGDVGGLATDIGFLPTASFCGRIRGDYLNLTADLCGNRFGRGLVVAGGVAHDADQGLRERMLKKLVAMERDTRGAVHLFFGTPSVLARLEGSGVLTRVAATELGLVGVAARACGLVLDVRRQHPWPGMPAGPDQVAVAPDGDVNARGRVRQREIELSLAWLKPALADLPDGATRVPLAPPAAASVAVAMVEGWRGEIVHVAITDNDGGLARYKIVDPSFHNWSGLAMALRGEQISDFPLINKSFNLSYCGHDL
jgi:Ni,Fe-hydrogenase III large subunit